MIKLQIIFLVLLTSHILIMETPNISGSDLVEPDCRLSLFNENFTIYSDEIHNATAEIFGNLCVNESFFHGGIVEMRVSICAVASDFICVNLPNLTMNKENNEMNFSFFVVSSKRFIACLKLEFMLWMNWTTYPEYHNGSTDPIKTTAVLIRDFNLSVDVDERIEVKAGEKAKIPILINNTGTGEDAPMFFIVNYQELLDRGWDVSLPTHRHLFSSGRSELHYLYLEIPINERSGEIVIEIELYSREGKYFDWTPLEIIHITIVVDGIIFYDIGPQYFIGGIILIFILLFSFIASKIVWKHKATRTK